MNDYPDFAEGDSGVPLTRPPKSYPAFTSPVIERWNEMQLEQSAGDMPKAKGIEEIVNEIFSRLMNFGTDKTNAVADRIAALEAAWRVYADYARLVVAAGGAD